MNLDLLLRACMTRRRRRRPTRVVTTSLDAMASRRHVRPPRRRLRPLLDRPRVAGAPLREDALRPGAAGPRVPPRPHWSRRPAQYRQVVEETIEYVLRDLRHPDGGFFSAEDADSPDERRPRRTRALFYIWTADEVRAAARAPTPDGARSTGSASPTPGQLRGPHRSPTGCTPAAISSGPPHIDRARAALFAAREQRPAPGLDDKVLTEWNALLLSTLAEAAAAFERDRLDGRPPSPTASSSLRELRDARRPLVPVVAGRRRPRPATPPSPPTTPRSWTRSRGSPRRPARPAGSTRRRDRRHDARPLLGPDQGGVFTTADDAEPLVVRQKDLLDNATPSANSTRRGRPATGWPRSPASSATPTTPTGSCSCSPR